jgi:hypothetical protein
VFNCLMRLTGPLFVIGFYVLLGMNIHAYFSVILLVIKKRLGQAFGLMWVAIGLSLVYNIVYNHFFATFIKPGSPKDLKVSSTQMPFKHSTNEACQIFKPLLFRILK